VELTPVGPDLYACLQPDEGLGYSNSGFVNRGGGLVVDTFWDLPRTRRLMSEYASVGPGTPRRLVNTHHNGDHCWGNQLFAEVGTEIIGHRLCGEYFSKEADPSFFVSLCQTDDADLGTLSGFVQSLRRFDFEGIELTPPTTVVDGDTRLDLDGLAVDLLYVGPAHTPGDVVVHVPEHRVVFTGDILFNQCTPIGWEGTFDSWIAGLARLEALDPEVVVPGHGPLGRVEDLRHMREYLTFVRDESRRHYDDGLTTLEAAKRIELGRYAGWNEPERLAFQVDRAYREFGGEAWDAPVDVMKVFGELAALREHFASA
jgi:cyclase